MLLSCCINLVKLQKCWLSKILGMTYNLERREYLIFPEIIKLIGSWQKSSNHPRALSKFIFLFTHEMNIHGVKIAFRNQNVTSSASIGADDASDAKLQMRYRSNVLYILLTKQVLMRVNTKMLIWYLCDVYICASSY